MDLLHNTIQNYAWGSRHHLAELQGRPNPSAKPEAELWMGAHPSAPSHLERDGQRVALTEVITAAPERELGPSAQRHGPRLPYLLKFLAAAVPLSIQVHPNTDQAAAGFAAEESAGVALDDPKRNYRDASHKPELLCAVTEFEALCGFRPVAEAREILGGLPSLAKYAAKLDGKHGLREVISGVLRVQDARGLMTKVLKECRAAIKADAPHREVYQLALRIAEHFTSDAGVIVAMLLNYVRLQPGEAIFVPAGVMHAYLAGAGVEVMASSDNVLRGGLTPKHVDVEELLRITRWESQQPMLIAPDETDPAALQFITPAAEFSLTAVVLEENEVVVELAGPRILFCAEGAVTASDAVSGIELAAGASGFSPDHAGAITLRGAGTVFIAAPAPR